MDTDISIKFSRLYKIIAIIAVICLIIPMICTLSPFPVRNSALINPLSVAVCVVFGYLLQSGYALVTKNKRRAGTYAYEDDAAKFETARAAVPIIITAAVSIYMRSVLNKMFAEYAHVTEGVYYDEYSAVPYIGAILIFLMIMAGIALWFYSSVHFANLKVFLVATMIMIMEFAFSLYSGGTMGNVFAVCGIIYFTCAVILMNQVYIQRTFKGSVVSIITPQARFYNMGLSGLMVLFACGLFVFFIIMFTGISVLIKIILFFLLVNILRDSPSGEQFEYYDPSEAGEDFIKVVFGDEQAANNQFAFAIFIVIIFLFFLFLILRKHISLRKIYAAFHTWIQNVLAFLFNAYDFNRMSNIKNINYKDEEEKIQDAHISAYTEKKSTLKTYRDFQHHMGRLRTYDEKIGFAYKTLIQMYLKMNLALKSSDTPREIKRKVENGIQTAEISDITEVIELVKYAEQELDKTDRSKADRILDTICNIIKKYMY